jgi:hypothetical protein
LGENRRVWCCRRLGCPGHHAVAAGGRCSAAQRHLWKWFVVGRLLLATEAEGGNKHKNRRTDRAFCTRLSDAK